MYCQGLIYVYVMQSKYPAEGSLLTTLLIILLIISITKRQSGNGIDTLPILQSQGGSELARCIAYME